jgi:hypothetical protein
MLLIPIPLLSEYSRYDLIITPDLDAFTFQGEVSIALTTSAECATNEISLHAKELCFISAKYVVGDQSPVEAQEVS